MYKRRKGIHPVVLILIFALLCVAATAVVLLSMGYRYVTTSDGFKFFGKIVDGQPVSGTIRYRDGARATLDYYNNTIEYSNGDKYKGDILQLYRHGEGTMEYYATGDTYTGRFAYDEITGKGTYSFSNGDTYTGDLVGSKMEGSGKYSWADGSVYVGEFKNGLADGEGVFTFAAPPGATGSKYEGSFANGVKNGKGTFFFDNGDIYTGSFVNDRRTGTGTYKWANGETYTGNFIDSMLDTRLKDDKGEFILNKDGSYAHGEAAVYTWPSGRSYTGYFESGHIVVVENK